jgi:hypothetical protein
MKNTIHAPPPTNYSHTPPTQSIEYIQSDINFSIGIGLDFKYMLSSPAKSRPIDTCDSTLDDHKAKQYLFPNRNHGEIKIAEQKKGTVQKSFINRRT